MASHRAETADALPLKPLIVVGSYDWDNMGAVAHAVNQVKQLFHDRTLMVITSGCPTGAERFAVELAESSGWVVHAMRDEEQLRVEDAYVLGFIKDNSNVASLQVQRLSLRFPARVFRDDTFPQISGWEDR